MHQQVAMIGLVVFVLAGLLVEDSAASFSAQKQESRNVLRVGIMDDCPPYNFFDEQNRYVGMNIDIIEEMARRSGMRVELKSVSYNRLMMGLLFKQYDVVAAPQSMNGYREQTVHFLKPYHYSSDAFVYHPQRTPVRSLADIKAKNLKIGVFNGTSYPEYLKGEGLGGNVRVYPTQREMYLAFLNGKVDVIMADTYIAEYYREHRDFPFGIAEEHVRHKAMAFSTRKEDMELAAILEKSFASMEADGTLETIRARWIAD
jgi:ABC-type amino acid transport substrate-binding protein